MSSIDLQIVVEKQQIDEDRKPVTVAVLTKTVVVDLEPQHAMNLHHDGEDFYVTGRKHKEKDGLHFEGSTVQIFKNKFPHPIEHETREFIKRHREMGWKVEEVND